MQFKGYRKAMKAYSADREGVLKIEAGDIIEQFSDPQNGWAKGRIRHTNLSGWFPFALTAEISAAEVQQQRTPVAGTPVARANPPSAPATPQSQQRPTAQTTQAQRAPIQQQAAADDESEYYEEEDEEPQKPVQSAKPAQPTPQARQVPTQPVQQSITKPTIVQSSQPSQLSDAQLQALKVKLRALEQQLEGLREGKAPEVQFVEPTCSELQDLKTENEALKQQLMQLEVQWIQAKTEAELATLRHQRLVGQLKTLEGNQQTLQNFAQEKTTLQQTTAEAQRSKENQYERTQILIETAGLGQQRVDWAQVQKDNVLVRQQNTKLAAEQELVPTPARIPYTITKRKEAKTRQDLDVELDKIRAKYGIQ